MRTFLFLLGFGVFILGCGEVKVAGLNQSEFEGSASTCTTDTAPFAAKIVPIFSSQGCTSSGCHGNSGARGGLTLDGDTAAVFAAVTGGTDRVKVSDPDASKILRKPLGLDNHGGSKIFDGTTDSDYVLLRCWISSGALNN